MEEDLEVLQAMYLNGEEISVYHYPQITRVTLNIQQIRRLDKELMLITDIVSGKGTICDIRLKRGNESVDVALEKLASDPATLLVSTVLDSVQERLAEFSGYFLGQQCSEEAGDVELCRLVYDLDHIRNAGKYHKSLAKFAKQTCCCCLLYQGKGLIRVIVEGSKEQVRGFLKLHKTSTVDVDSNGMYYVL